MMTGTPFETCVQQYLDAWNANDPASVVACFVDDLTYVDAATHGPVRSKEALGHYLGRLFSKLHTTFSVQEIVPFAGGTGGAVVWSLSLRRAEQQLVKVGSGVDLLFMRGRLIERVESYYDRTPYAELFV